MDSRKKLLNEADLREGAFMLLSCSSLTRYARMAKVLAQTSGLRRRIESGEVTLLVALRYAEGSWQKLLQKEQRDIEEVELAAIITALAHSASEQVSAFLIRIAMIDRASVSWVSALARRLYQERPANQDIRIQGVEIPLSKIKTYNTISRNTDILVKPTVYTNSKKLSATDELIAA